MITLPKIGLVLGGGGARGLAHLGVLKVLQNENIKIDYIVGVSMGSLIAAYYALGFDLREIEKEALSFNRARALRELFDFSNPSKSIIGNHKAIKFISKIIKDKNFSDTKIPLRIIATNLGKGEQVIISSGNLSKAIMASSSVPGIFPPIKYGHDYLIDGGVVNPVPIDVISKMGADLIIAVDLVMNKNIKMENPSIIDCLLRSYDIIRAQSINFNYLNTNHKRIIMLKPQMRSLKDSFRFHDMHKFIEAGEKVTQDALPEIKKHLI